ncbi:MAG TPA: S9 family peptidase [Gemmataceae bacterium]|nr:S9 family peptidase [Gemmataceae bacterium]
MRQTVLAALFMVLTARADAAGVQEAYTPEQLSLVRNVSECRLAPNGQTVAFITDITGVPELWTVPAAGGWPTQLTSLNENVSDIDWSPDGQWLVFASDYGGNERRDLFRVAAAGGAVEKLTDTKLSESEPRISPDGKRLAFTADPDKDFDFQLHVMDLETKNIRRLTREKEKVQVPRWSPDGKIIAINRSGDDQKGDLLLVDANTAATVVVPPTVKNGILWPAEFAPDGKSLLLRARNEKGFVQMAVLGLALSSDPGKPPKPNGPPTFIGPGDWDVIEAHWSKHGLVFLRNEGGSIRLAMMPGPGDKWSEWPVEGSLRQVSLARAKARISLLREDIDRPADVWVMDLGSQPRPDIPSDKRTVAEPATQVTFSLLGGVKAEQLSTGRMVAYESFDQRKIHTLVVKPRIPRLGNPPPAIVYVHGGPNSQHTFSFDPYIHVLAEAGFVVLAPNYRGSTGYGKQFEDLNNKDWGGGDLKDLVWAVKHFAAKGEIDGKRVGITGGSYGGYMTLMALARTPDIWAAGVELYGMPDLVMDYLLTKSRFGDWYETEMGNPKTHAALFRERSPLPYLDDIKAPLLIFQGTNDTNVPKSEADLLVAVLKELKKEYEYIVYDNEGHGFTRRQNLLDFYRRSSEFFAKKLGPKE